MSAALNWIKARLSEPSTWAGIAIAATAVASGLSSGASWSALLGGVLAAVLKEKSA